MVAANWYPLHFDVAPKLHFEEFSIFLVSPSTFAVFRNGKLPFLAKMRSGELNC
jgi:hypothetical protein